MIDRRGFTLVEILVSSMMLALVATAGFAVFSGGIRSAAKARRHGAMTAYAQRALLAMASDIRSSVPHEKYRLKSLDVQLADGDFDTIDFIVARPQLRGDENDTSSRSEIGYYIDTIAETEAKWLLRREDRTPDDDLLEGGNVSMAGSHVSELNLLFFDGLMWQSGWENEIGHPKAVNIEIVVVDEDEIEKPMRFTTSVSLVAE